MIEPPVETEPVIEVTQWASGVPELTPEQRERAEAMAKARDEAVAAGPAPAQAWVILGHTYEEGIELAEACEPGDASANFGALHSVDADLLRRYEKARKKYERLLAEVHETATKVQPR